MKTPPFLMGAALLFWGWQSGLFFIAVAMALVLEGHRWVETRWEFSNEDFTRIWTFCTLLLLAATVYAFTTNEGPSSFRGFFQNPSLRTERNAGLTTARTIASLIRWLPMLFFLFVGAQLYSVREGVPLETISLIMRWRWKRARARGQALPETRTVNISYPYFGLCLMAASAHSGDDKSYFWGLCLLLAWGLWPHRSRNLALWSGTLGVAIMVGYYGQGGLTKLQRYLETINAQWFAGFGRRGFDATQTKTALGQIGKVKTSGKIVIRLEPWTNGPAPTLLREASYRNYRVNTWYAGNSRDDFVNVLNDTNETTYVLLPGKTNRHVVNIGCYLPGGHGLLPLPGGSGRLEKLLVILLQRNSAGAVVAEGPGLVVFDSFYGPGLTIDSPPDGKEDIVVSTNEKPAIQKIAAELEVHGSSLEDKLQAVSSLFQSKFNYSLWQNDSVPRSTNETALSRFLLKTRKGHCEYFATATVLLLRELGIPARYAVGYAVHEMSGKKYVVRQRDGHAWCLYWNEKKKLWMDFDTTPASWVAAEESRASRWQPVSDFWSRLMFEFAKVRWGQTNLRQYIIWALIPVMGLLLYQIVFRRRQKRPGGRGNEGALPFTWPGLDSEFYILERKLVGLGVTRETGEPLSAWLTRAAADPNLVKLSDALRELLALHYRYRFDPQGISPRERNTLSRQARACLAAVEKG